MPAEFRCIYPCKKIFAKESSLRSHYARVPQCKWNWQQREAALVREFEEASQRRRAEMRDAQNERAHNDDTRDHVGGAGHDTDIGDQVGIGEDNVEMVDHASGWGDINHGDEVRNGPSDQDPSPSQAPSLANPIPTTPLNQAPALDNGDLPAMVDYEEYLPGPEQGLPTSEGNDTPYIDASHGIEVEEAQPGYVPEIDDVEQLGADLEAVEISPESDEESDPSEVESFPRAGEVKTPGDAQQSYFENLRQETHGQPFHPFRSFAEFELAKWLNDLPLSKTDSFLQLDWVRGQSGTSFGSGKGMREQIEKLPKPRMMWQDVEIVPRSGTASFPIHLCYRDPVDVIKSLLDRPALEKHMSYTPQRVWRDKAAGKRQYTEIFTAEWSWRVQETLPVGATLLPVLFGSDKAHLTDYSGDKSAWPLYMSLGNIHSSIRNKPSAECWVLLAYIPIPVFNDPKELHTSLQQRLFHQCLKIIVSSLKRAGERGQMFTDSLGQSRFCFPRLAAYLADYPEQVLINVAAHQNSPVTTAGFNDLGNAKPHPRRTKEWILSQIATLCDQVDPDDVAKYLDAAKKIGLNAVDQPFWEDLTGYEPDLVICPDILHGLFRMWRDHILKWVRYLVGTKELDNRLKVLQPIVGIRHFANGISHLSQWSGREDRELQRVLLAAIAGSPQIDVNTMRCLQAFHDFLYLAQYRSHTTTTLGYLEQSYAVFHQLKKSFITNGARRGKKTGVIPHFCFPKMAGLQQYAYHIPLMGSSVQFSTEITETCHQTMAKAAYKATNRKEFFTQMCAYMNRQARLKLTMELGTWAFERTHARGATTDLAATPDYIAFLRRMTASAKKDGKLEIRNRSRARNGYIWLTIKADKSNLPIDNLLRNYRLDAPSFRTALISFLAGYSTSDMPVSLVGMNSDAWYRCRVQRKTIQDDDELADARTIQAEPPTLKRTQHGLCNCALINDSDDAEVTGIHGYRVGQVRLIFQLRLPANHPLHGVPLAYVYWFSRPLPKAEPHINMYKLRYIRGDNNIRTGGIVPLSSVTRLIQMVPAYGATVNPEFTAENSMDRWRDYYVNSFMDKETYQAVW